ncbi:MAG: LLM class F420-dependent oxidoreductase [Nakamurella sp.]
MRLGLSLPLASSAAGLRNQVELAVAADRLGYDIVWVPEAYGGDAVSILASIAARTERIEIGSAVLQIPARTPAMTAMTAASLDALSRGRFRLGLGVSGPQVSEGWHGVGFANPLGRTREYVQIVRDALARRKVVAEGKYFTLPLPGGPGKPLVLALETERPTVPVYLAAVGPKSVALAGEIADGWLSIFFDSHSGTEQIDAIQAAATAAGRDPASIDIAVQVPVSFANDAETAAQRVRPYAALYIGGMGSKKVNFYHGIASRMGYGAESDEVQRLFLSRDYAGAAEAVPQEFLARTCLIGNDADITAGLLRLRDAGVTTAGLNLISLPLPLQIEGLEHVMALARDAGVLG